MSLLNVIKSRLTDQAVVNGSSWIAYIGWTPDDQDQVVSLTPSGGYAQDTMENDNTIETFQVRVRAGRLAYNTCENKWRDMYDALHDADLSASPDFIHLVQADASGPLYFADQKQRPNMTCNFRVVRARP